MYDVLYKQLESIKLDLKKRSGFNNRLGFPEHRGAVFGIIKPRYKQQIKQLSLYSKKYPKIYDEIIRIGKEVCPFPFTSIQVNKNCQCPPHKDKSNVGDSCLVSFGEYTGGHIYIEGVKYNAYHNPIIFDGHKLEHWNDDHIGTKYSLVFFNLK